MKHFARFVLACLLACIALTEVQAELPASPRRTWINVVTRSLRGVQLVIGTLAQHSLFRIQAADSTTWQISDDLPTKKGHQHGRGGDDAIVTGESYSLDAGKSSNGAVVLLGGYGEINGTVNGDLVLIGSKATLAGTVNGDLVTIGSNLNIYSGAVANGDYVSVTSEVKGEQELTANGERVTLNTFSPAVPVIKEVLTNIVQLRPMSPSSRFSWSLLIIALIVCSVLSLIVPKVFARTETIIRDRPGPSLLVGLAVILGGAMLSFLLTITVIGIIALPFLALALFILNILGGTSVCYSLGKRIAPQFAERRSAVYVWIILGTVVIWTLFCIPIIGFIAAGLVSLLGLGAFVIYLVDRYWSNTPQPQLPTSAPREPENPPAVHSSPLALPNVEPAIVIGAPRAQFLPRLLANIIDLIVLYVLLRSLHLTHATIPVWVLYRFGMFAWKSSTLGQIVLNLRVQKPDGTFLVGDYSGALIRALSSVLSLIPLGLGFIWILFNRDLEAWHDKISATYVVQLNASATRSTTPPSSAGPTATPPPTM
jgi:MFS family permease